MDPTEFQQGKLPGPPPESPKPHQPCQALQSRVEFAPKALKLKDAAKVLGLTQKTVARLVQRGHLKRLPHLRHVVITTESINEFVSE